MQMLPAIILTDLTLVPVTMDIMEMEQTAQVRGILILCFSYVMRVEN